MSILFLYWSFFSAGSYTGPATGLAMSNPLFHKLLFGEGIVTRRMRDFLLFIDAEVLSPLAFNATNVLPNRRPTLVSTNWRMPLSFVAGVTNRVTCVPKTLSAARAAMDGGQARLPQVGLQESMDGSDREGELLRAQSP